MSAKKAAVVAVVSLAVGAVVSFAFLNYGIKGASRSEETVKRLEESASEYVIETTTHRTETEQRVVVIRETVREEIRSLGPDGLALAALAEIELFRRRAGSDSDTSSSGLDSQ